MYMSLEPNTKLQRKINIFCKDKGRKTCKKLLSLARKSVTD